MTEQEPTILLELTREEFREVEKILQKYTDIVSHVPGAYKEWEKGMNARVMLLRKRDAIAEQLREAGNGE